MHRTRIFDEIMIIAIVNQKGGTGKTTTTVNLGSALAKLGKRVLLVDLDAQGNLSYSLGISEFDKSIGEMMLEEKMSAHLIEKENMKILPTGTELANYEMKMMEMPGRESLLKQVLKDTVQYDYVLIDCPPAISLLTVNALNSAEKVLIPLQMDVLSMQGLSQVFETISKVKNSINKNLKVIGLLEIMVDKRKKLTREIQSYIKDNFDVKVFKTSVRTNVRAAEAPSYGLSVIAYAPHSNSAKDYMSFANEFIASVN